MKKRLLIVTEALEMNGVLRSLLDFMEAIDKNRYDIELFCFDSFKPDYVTLPSYVRLLKEDPWCYMARAPLSRVLTWGARHGTILPVITRLFCSAFQGKFRRFAKRDLIKQASFRQDHYDVAIAYSMGMTWWYLAEKISATTKIAWLHTDYRAAAQNPAWRFYAKFLDRITALVCVSNGIRNCLSAEYPGLKAKVWCVHSVVDSAAILAKGAATFEHARKRKFRIVTVGRFSPQKNQVLIPQIAEEMRSQGLDDFEWIMAGPGADGCRVDDPNLFYLDAISNPIPLIKSADVYVQPSTYEGWGLTVTEAMVLGRYVVTSDIVSFVEQIPSANYGQAVPLEAKAFALAIVDALRSGRYGQVPPYVCPYTAELNRTEFEKVIVG